MSAIARVFVVLNLVFSVVVLGSVGALLVKGEDYRVKTQELNTKISDLETELSEVRADRDSTKRSYETDMRNLQEQIDSRDKDIQIKDDDIKSLNDDNDQLRGAVTQIQATLGDIKTDLDNYRADNTKLRDDLATAQDAERNARAAQQQAEDDRDNAQRALSDAGDQIAALETTIQSQAVEIADNVAKLQVVASRGIDIGSLMVQEQIDAVVQAVDSAAGFVVLSKGANDNVQPGNVFFISSGGTYVGRVTVEDVHPNNSVARIDYTADNRQISSQNNATTRL